MSAAQKTPCQFTGINHGCYYVARTTQKILPDVLRSIGFRNSVKTVDVLPLQRGFGVHPDKVKTMNTLKMQHINTLKNRK